MTEAAKEREIDRGLLIHLRDLFLELAAVSPSWEPSSANGGRADLLHRPALLPRPPPPLLCLRAKGGSLASENGGWDVTDLWNVDQSIADDMFTVLHLIRAEQPAHQQTRMCEDSVLDRHEGMLDGGST